MIILGIDPGLATLGYGVISRDQSGSCEVIGYGVVTTPKEESLPTRLVLLEDGVNQILQKYKPDQIAFEELFFSKNITTGIAVSHARGVAMLACVKQCPYLYEYTPMQIKQALTGYGKAEKQQIQQVVKTMLKLESIPRPDDAADALAIALCHATASRYGNMFQVNNMTRTKGNNTAEGRAFQKMVSEQIKKEDAKAAQAAKVSSASKRKPASGVKKQLSGTSETKKSGAGTCLSGANSAKTKKNTAAQIAKMIAVQMQKTENNEG